MHICFSTVRITKKRQPNLVSDREGFLGLLRVGGCNDIREAEKQHQGGYKKSN
jgi:hypothetical protein